MAEYLVLVTGSVCVEADSPAEARELALLNLSDLQEPEAGDVFLESDIKAGVWETVDAPGFQVAP